MSYALANEGVAARSIAAAETRATILAPWTLLTDLNSSP